MSLFIRSEGDNHHGEAKAARHHRRKQLTIECHDGNNSRSEFQDSSSHRERCTTKVHLQALGGIFRKRSDWGIPMYLGKYVAFLMYMFLSTRSVMAQDQTKAATTLKPGDSRNDNGIKLTLVWCPPGTFVMGSPPGETGRGNNEEQASVSLAGYWLGQTEVTQSQWTCVLRTTPWKGIKDYPDATPVKEGPNYPAVYVSHSDSADSVEEYCKTLTAMEMRAGRLASGWAYRLPTEAEWEYACRAGTTTAYYFGADTSTFGKHGWWGGVVGDGNAESEPYAHHVGTKLPNAWGLKDMHGNVWEWCSDRYAEKLVGGLAPAGPVSGPLRVYRGGSWYDKAENCRSASRPALVPTQKSTHVGFRLVLGPISNSGQENAAATNIEGSKQPSVAVPTLPAVPKSPLVQQIRPDEVKIPTWQMKDGGAIDGELIGLLLNGKETRLPVTLAHSDYKNARLILQGKAGLSSQLRFDDLAPQDQKLAAKVLAIFCGRTFWDKDAASASLKILNGDSNASTNTFNTLSKPLQNHPLVLYANSLVRMKDGKDSCAYLERAVKLAPAELPVWKATIVASLKSRGAGAAALRLKELHAESMLLAQLSRAHIASMDGETIDNWAWIEESKAVLQKSAIAQNVEQLALDPAIQEQIKDAKARLIAEREIKERQLEAEAKQREAEAQLRSEEQKRKELAERERLTTQAAIAKDEWFKTKEKYHTAFAELDKDWRDLRSKSEALLESAGKYRSALRKLDEAYRKEKEAEGKLRSQAQKLKRGFSYNKQSPSYDAALANADAAKASADSIKAQANLAESQIKEIELERDRLSSERSIITGKSRLLEAEAWKFVNSFVATYKAAIPFDEELNTDVSQFQKIMLDSKKKRDAIGKAATTPSMKDEGGKLAELLTFDVNDEIAKLEAKLMQAAAEKK